jgi:hypothetical protein
MKALVEVRDWDGLDAFVKAKRSPVGYEPLVEHLRLNGMLRQAVSYIPKCESRNRVELFVRCSEWKMAGDEAKQRGDRSKLLSVPLSFREARIESFHQRIKTKMPEQLHSGRVGHPHRGARCWVLMTLHVHSCAQRRSYRGRCHFPIEGCSSASSTFEKLEASAYGCNACGWE